MDLCLKHKEKTLAIVQHKSVISSDRESVFLLLSNPLKWPLLLPEDFEMEMQTQAAQLHLNQNIQLRIGRFGFSSNYTISVEEIKTHKIRLRQILGVFKNWEMHIEITERKKGECLLLESVQYQLPFGILGALVDDFFTNSDIKKTLRIRHKKVEQLLNSSC